MEKIRSMKKKIKSANHKSFRNKADKLFMPQFHGQPCEVCGTTINTCGHHCVSKSRSKALRYDHRNIIVLCPAHHTMGNDLAPHATNQLAVERFVKWFNETHPGRHAWLIENEYIQRRYSYKQACENMTNGLNAWE